MHQRVRLLFKNSRCYGKVDRRVSSRRERNKIQVKKEGETIAFQERGMSSSLADVWNGTFAVQGTASRVPNYRLIRSHCGPRIQRRAFPLQAAKFTANFNRGSQLSCNSVQPNSGITPPCVHRTLRCYIEGAGKS